MSALLLMLLFLTSRHNIGSPFRYSSTDNTSGTSNICLWTHVEGGFGVTFNGVGKDAVFYTTTSRFVT
jgi:hypothetical protein